MDTSKNLSTGDLVLIRKALHAYMEHLNPSAMHVKEVADWRERISEVEHKISGILLTGKSL